jgi:hypothetical protein
MRYLRLYEEFRVEELEEIEVQKNQESDKTIDDVLNTDFFTEEKEVYQDSKGVYHIKNWIVY